MEAAACYGLSPSARRVGLALLDHLNVHNGRCDPSEARLAAMLHISARAVRNGKAELRRAGCSLGSRTADYHSPPTIDSISKRSTRRVTGSRHMRKSLCRGGVAGQSGSFLPVCIKRGTTEVLYLRPAVLCQPDRKSASTKLIH
jgi:hypothetical protein